MKVAVTKDVNLLELQKKVDTDFPGYKTSIRQSRILVVKKSGSAAALILAGNKKGVVKVNEGFPTMGQQMVFTLLMVLTGILIPLIVYFAAFYPGQKAIRNEMAEYVKKEYN